MKYRAFSIILLALSISWGHAAETTVKKPTASKSALKAFTQPATLKAMELPCMQKHPSGNYFMAAAGGGSSGAGFTSSSSSGGGTGYTSGGAGGSGGSGAQAGAGPLTDEIKQYQEDMEKYHEDFAKYQKQQHEYRFNQPQGKTPPTPPSLPTPPMNLSQSRSTSLSSKPLTPAEQKKRWIAQVDEDILFWNERKKLAVNEQNLIKEYAVKENAVETTEKIDALIQLKEAAVYGKINQLNKEKQYIEKNGVLPPSRKDSNNNPVITQVANIDAAKKAYYNGEIRKQKAQIADLQQQLTMGLAELNTLKQLASQENASDTVQFINSIINGKNNFAQSSIDRCKKRAAGFEAKRDGKANPSGQNMGGSFGAGGPQGGMGGGAKGGGGVGGGARRQQ